MAEVKKNSRVLTLFAGMLAMVVLFSLAGPAHAQTTIRIDPFNDGAQGDNNALRAEEGATVIGNVSTSTAIGGHRKVSVTETSGIEGAYTGVQVRPTILGGIVQIGVTPTSEYEIKIIWDGATLDDDTWDGTTIDYEGLGEEDLVNLGGNQVADGIVLSIIGWEGNDIDIVITVYTDENNYSQATYNITGTTFVGPYEVALCYYEGCFDVNIGNGADFTKVGAIVMDINSVQPGADLELSLAVSAAARDFGDLPDTYTTTISDTAAPLIVNEEGARHSRGNIYLGSCVTRELNGQPDDDAELDGCDDGIDPIGTTIDGQWQNGLRGGAVRVTWTSPDTPTNSWLGVGNACLDGWINWSHDSNYASSPTNNHFGDDDTLPGTGYSAAQKHVVQGHKLRAGDFPNFPIPTSLVEDVYFNIPANFFSMNSGDPNVGLASRWRIYPTDLSGNCPVGGLGTNGYKGYIINGEVEDYIWGFTPTAVTLQSFSPAASHTPVVALVGFLSLALVAFSVVIVRRERSR